MPMPIPFWRSFSCTLLLVVAFLLPALPSVQPSSMECPSPMFRPQRRAAAAGRPHGTMATTNYSNILQQPSPLHFYAITQDCQFVIARPDQLNKLSSLRVLAHSRECHPSRVQLLWSSSSSSSPPSLLLLQKRTSNELCILPIEMPTPLAIYGPELFSYSLRSALSRFAKCSCPFGAINTAAAANPRIPNSSQGQGHSTIHIDPPLIFPDSLYSDLFYHLSSASPHSNWTLNQLQMSPHGHFHSVDQFRVHPMAKGWRHAGELLLANDAQKRRLFAMTKRAQDSAPEWTCPFDLIFRPDQAKIHRYPPLFPSRSLLSQDATLTGFSVDRHIAIFTVQSGAASSGGPQYELFLTKLDPKGHPEILETHCVLRLGFAAKFGVISAKTLKEMTEKGALPTMGQRARSASSKPSGHSAINSQIWPTKMPSLTSSSTSLWHKYNITKTNSTTPRPLGGNGRGTVKTTATTTTRQEYFWHRMSTTRTTKSTKMPQKSSASTGTATKTKAVENGKEEKEMDEAETWNEEEPEDYEDLEEEAGKGQVEGEAEEEEEEILPLPDEASPTPAQMIRADAGGTKANGGTRPAAAIQMMALTVGMWLFLLIATIGSSRRR